jgi:hypothetical protein
MLYSHNYYTEDEFWSLYDHGKIFNFITLHPLCIQKYELICHNTEHYEALRTKWGAKGRIPDIYDKVNEHFLSF